MRLSAAQLSALIEGLDWRRVRRGEGHGGAEAAGMTCGEVNQGLENRRKALRIMVSSDHDAGAPRRFPTIPRR